MNSPVLKTELLGEDETLNHRKVVFEGGGKWRCDTCGFEEPCIIAWKAVTGGPIRMSCHECHLYEDPLRYREEVALAYLPVIPKHMLSHLIRLTLATSRAELGRKIAASAMSAEADPHLRTLASRVLADVDEAEQRKEKLEVLLASKFDAAIHEFVKGMGANIGLGLQFGRTIFPDADMTLRVLALGASEDVAEIADALRLIPKNIRTSRAATWKLHLDAGLIAETLAFAKANIKSVDLPEAQPTEQPEALMDEDGEQRSLHKEVYAELQSRSGGDAE
jgi:hypothetical protein